MAEFRRAWSAERMACQRFTMLYLVPALILTLIVLAIGLRISGWQPLSDIGGLWAALPLALAIGLMCFFLARTDQGHGFGVIVGKFFWTVPIFAKAKARLRADAEFRANATVKDLYDHDRARFERFMKKMGSR